MSNRQLFARVFVTTWLLLDCVDAVRRVSQQPAQGLVVHATGPGVYPARVEGTQLVHVAIPLVSDDGDVTMRAICPAGAAITRPLEPVEADAVFVYCPACKSWADAAGLPLPRSR